MTHKYFTENELRCKCGCGAQKMDFDFMRKLEQIRKSAGFAFHVTSAYRCPAHNARVSSTGHTGPHTTGRAIDIAADGKKKYAILELARGAGMKRFGIGKTFIHLDDLEQSEGFADRVIWTY